jgi:hypothetical protein
METVELERSALLSRCGTYRWRLERKTANDGIVAAIIGVNPSTADAEVDDPTIRKDMGFAARLGWRRIIKGNLFAYRATDIKDLRGLSIDTAVGPENDAHLIEMFKEADVVVAAWGPTAKLPPRLRNRWRRVVSIADHYQIDLMCFGTAQDGQPRHTLMLAYDTPLVPWPAQKTEGA